MGVMFTAIGITVTGMKSGNMTPQEAVGMIGQNSQPLIFSLFIQLFLSNFPIYNIFYSSVKNREEEIDVKDFLSLIKDMRDYMAKLEAGAKEDRKNIIDNFENLNEQLLNLNVNSNAANNLLLDIKNQNAEIFGDIAKNNSEAMMKSIQHLMETIADKVNNEIKDTVEKLNISCREMVSTTNKFEENMGSYSHIVSNVNQSLTDLNGAVSQTKEHVTQISTSANEIANSTYKMNGAFNVVSAASSGVVSAAKQISDSTSLMQKDAIDYIQKIEEISREHMKKYGNVNAQLIDGIFKSVQANVKSIH